jgi:hypothetical protein
MAYGVVHKLKSRLKAGYVPVFSTDGLNALTAHFLWEMGVDGKEKAGVGVIE